MKIATAAQIEYRKEVDVAFEKALANGRLSRNKTAGNYVGHYMYMGPGKGGDAFKHSLTRLYID